MLLIEIEKRAHLYKIEMWWPKEFNERVILDANNFFLHFSLYFCGYYENKMKTKYDTRTYTIIIIC